MTIDDGFPRPRELSTGFADADVDESLAWDSRVRAILWLPDPEMRRGWREFYVRQSAAPKPGGKIGFKPDS